MFWVRSEGFGFIGSWMSFTLGLTDYHAPNSFSISYTTILMVIDVPLWMSLHFAHFRYTIILMTKKNCWWWWRRRFMITMMVTVLLRNNGFLHCLITDGAVSCDKVITRDEVISSPGHPGRYPPNQVCLYRIQVSTL